MSTDQPSTYLTPSTPPLASSTSSSTPKPTLLAFHGSGSNATIHTIQLARLTRLIKPHFNIISLDAPFSSPAGPGILPFFEGCGPYKRWLPPNEKVTIEVMRSGGSTGEMSAEVEDVVRQAVEKVRREGGKVVGLVGFSQGTKVVAGLLRGSEVRRMLGANQDEEAWCDFSFGLLVCPSYPPPLFPPSISKLVSKAGLSAEESKNMLQGKIGTPSCSVLGRQDEWNWAGKGMVDGHFEVEEGKARVLEVDMGHHYPVATEDSERVKEWMLEVLGRVESERAAK